MKEIVAAFSLFDIYYSSFVMMKHLLNVLDFLLYMPTIPVLIHSICFYFDAFILYASAFF